MGSLMSGWSSSVLSEREVRLLRNRSLTKDEVEAYWRQHGGRPAENGEAAAAGSPLAGGSPRVGHVTSPLSSSPRATQEIPLAARRLVAMRSMPPLRGTGTGTGMRSDDLGSPCAVHLFPRSEPSSPAIRCGRGEGFFHDKADAADADAGDTSCSTSRSWWTQSSWAFLNDPPKEEVVLGRAPLGFACDQFYAARIVTGNA